MEWFETLSSHIRMRGHLFIMQLIPFPALRTTLPSDSAR
jgi:hypothetical protein